MRMKASNQISSNLNILGGTPVVKGTRIPIARILHFLSQGFTVHDLKKEYPQLSVRKINQIIAAIACQAEKGTFLSS